MYEIMQKETLAPSVCRLVIAAPAVARKAAAGQFVILRLHAAGERIPLTIADYDRTAGTVTIVAQAVGKTTRELADFVVGDKLETFTGPLGRPSEVERYGTVVCVGGGVGIAPIYPIARAMRAAGNEVITIIGARSKELLFFEDELAAISSELLIATDDGTAGRAGFVTDILKEMLGAGKTVNLAVAVGPVPMMRAVAATTRPFGVKTTVSLNPIMVDGTGMCGACRVTVGGKMKFACVDGPEFDGHAVDFAELTARQAMYKGMEREARERYEAEHGGECRCR